ncbi:STN domain-containing protein [Microbacteriaceae bacterium K1510]|nr:STN domain-containing protein [Microbacteriaceae bacterium K1510]
MRQPVQADFKKHMSCCAAPCRKGRIYALLLVCMIVFPGVAAAQSVSKNAPIEFDIPSQPLGSALSRYIEVTGRDALYGTILATGQLSGEVRGLFTPDEALKKLLSGTGLAAEFVAETTFVLLSEPLINQQATRQIRTPEQRRYYGLIQAGITNALCRWGGEHVGHYRFATVFWIAADGAITRTQRIGTTGVPDADRRFDDTLRSVRFSEPPPANFLQPVLILIVPQGPGVARGCAETKANFGSVEVGP